MIPIRTLALWPLEDRVKQTVDNSSVQHSSTVQPSLPTHQMTCKAATLPARINILANPVKTFS